jgi:ribosomal protein S12 methylthiotransferase
MAGLADRHPDTWFRVMYLQPEGVTDELLDVMARHDNICSYLDIPFQHVNERILQAMNRRGSRTEYEQLIAHIRDVVPQVTLRTTVIAGFPGETDEDFEELCEFLEDADLDYVGVFPYSREDGTRGAELPDQIDEDVKIERAQQVRDIADALSEARVARRVGQRIDVLVLGREEDGQLFGRAQCQAPDVDGVVYLEEGTVGEMRTVAIVDTLLYEMEGE